MTPSPPEQPISVALVEDNSGLRNSLEVLLNGTEGFTCVGAYPTSEKALVGIPSRRPDVILMDINLPNKSGIDCVRELKSVLPQARIVMLTIFSDSDKIFAALTAGASGYLSKRTAPADILKGIHEVHQGGEPLSSEIAARSVTFLNRRGAAAQPDYNLSPRESQILELLVQGYLYKEIADELGIAFATVHWHIKKIYDKLHVRSRSQAIAKYLRNI
jgi:DNA-binding NarL/FixJ family response regulator